MNDQQFTDYLALTRLSDDELAARIAEAEATYEQIAPEYEAIKARYDEAAHVRQMLHFARASKAINSR